MSCNKDFCCYCGDLASCNPGYDVIGLCDPCALPPLRECSSWIQMTVPEILTIPNCYPDIESINKIYIKAKVLTKRIIETPPCDVLLDSKESIENIEGTRLTGKKLLVELEFCQTIIYTAAESVQSTHAVNFTFPFCTTIVLPKDTNPILDEFCIETCIEDVSASILSCRKIFKNVTVFLKADKLIF